MALWVGIYIVILNHMLTTTVGTVSTRTATSDDHVAHRAKQQLSSTCDHDALTTYLLWVADNYPEVTRLVPIGNSTEGRELWTVIISHNLQERPLLKPQVKFVGNINGYSGPSCVLLVKFITFLVENHDTVDALSELLQRTEIHVLPSMNPDGYVRSTPGQCFSEQRRNFRGNAKAVDLNRNFPDLFHPLDDDEDDPELEPETLAVIEWMKQNSFVVSTSFWSGAQIVTYPYDSVPTGHPPNTAHETPDTKTFEYLAHNYVGFVNEDPTSHWFCYDGKFFHDGIANGALLGSVSGTMMDYNYNNGVFELYIGMQCCRNADNATELEATWMRHKSAMISMVRQAEYSFRGQVVDSENGLPLHGAEILVIPPDDRQDSMEMDVNTLPIQMPFFTNERGEFFRVLLPGKYFLKVICKSYNTQTLAIEIPEEDSPEPLRITMVSVTWNRRRRVLKATTISTHNHHAVPQTMDNSIPTNAAYSHRQEDQQKATETITMEKTELDIHEEIRNINLIVQNPRFNFSSRNHDGIFHELEGYSKPSVSEHRSRADSQWRTSSACVFIPAVFLFCRL